MKVLGVIFTFNFVSFAWIFFRARSFADAGLMLTRVFTEFKAPLFSQWIAEYTPVAVLIAIGYLFHWMPRQAINSFERTMIRVPVYVQSVILAFVIWVLFQAKSADIQPFIYFQF